MIHWLNAMDRPDVRYAPIAVDAGIVKAAVHAAHAAVGQAGQADLPIIKPRSYSTSSSRSQYGSSTSVPTYQTYTFPKILMVKAKVANVRSSASKQGAIVTTFAEGKLVTVLGVTGEFYYFTLGDKTCYIHQSLLTY